MNFSNLLPMDHPDMLKWRFKGTDEDVRNKALLLQKLSREKYEQESALRRNKRDMEKHPFHNASFCEILCGTPPKKPVKMRRRPTMKHMSDVAVDVIQRERERKQKEMDKDNDSFCARCNVSGGGRRKSGRKMKTKNSYC